ncbi:MAG: ABC transporter permease [Actinomycetota bacterium]|nr:ABC transporter permease [Actinomycetota bacterium]
MSTSIHHERHDNPDHDERQQMAADAAVISGVSPTIADELVPSGKVHTRQLSTYIGPFIVFVLFISFWEYMHRDGMRRWLDKRPSLLPSPVTVIDQAFLDPFFRNQLIAGLGWTSYAAFIGLAITIVIGTGLAVFMAQAVWAERSIYPYLVALQATPVLAIVPIIYSVFGGGMSSRIYVCVMISLFPIVTNTLFGLTSVEASQHDLFTLRSAGRFTRLVKLQFPAAMPAIFTGFRISAGLAVIGAIVGEQFFRQGQKPGIGIVMEQFRTDLLYPPMYGGLLIAAALGIAVFLVFGFIGKLVVGHWHEPTRRGS